MGGGAAGCVQLAEGAVSEGVGAETMKDVAGYDTKRLFIGGRGAFGALTRLVFKIGVTVHDAVQ